MKKNQIRKIIRETIKELEETEANCEKKCHPFELKGDFESYATCRKRCIMKIRKGEKHVAVADALGLS